MFENKIHELQYFKEEVKNIGGKDKKVIRYNIRFHANPYGKK
jgi:hypothetical protein